MKQNRAGKTTCPALQSGRYVSYRQDNKDGVASFNMDMSVKQFSPQALRRKGRR